MIPFISSGLSNLIRLQIGEIASQKGIITAKPIRTLHWDGKVGGGGVGRGGEAVADGADRGD